MAAALALLKLTSRYDDAAKGLWGMYGDVSIELKRFTGSR